MRCLHCGKTISRADGRIDLRRDVDLGSRRMRLMLIQMYLMYLVLIHKRVCVWC